MHIRDLPKVTGVIRENGKSQAVIIDIKSYQAFLAKIKFEGKVDKTKYLSQHADVARGVKAGKIKDVTAHYVRNGHIDQRTATVLD